MELTVYSISLINVKIGLDRSTAVLFGSLCDEVVVTFVIGSVVAVVEDEGRGFFGVLRVFLAVVEGLLHVRLQVIRQRVVVAVGVDK